MRQMQVALYRGQSIISSLIQWQTRSVYSHVALHFPDQDDVFEAIAEGWAHRRGLGVYPRGTIVDLLEYKIPLTEEEQNKIRATCLSMVGAPYDYELVFAGFPLRYNWEPKRARKQFFCSEGAVIGTAAPGPHRLLVERTLPWKVSPEDINKSAALKWVRSVAL